MTGIMGDLTGFIMDRLMILPGIIIGLSFHEFGHAFVSTKLGDPTPRLQGRVSLNPAAHIDPIGFISLLVLGFGWGKPVQIDPRWYKHRRRDEILVSVAGVTINLLLAIAGAAIMSIYYRMAGSFISTTGGNLIMQILIGIVQINLVLMVFNLIPCPPLDGFGVITQLFELDRKPWYPRVYQLGPMILIILIIANVTSLIISPVVGWFYNTLINLFF